MRISQIQQQIGRGEYHVDTQAVAEAILRRLVQERQESSSEDPKAQGECS
jgi:hypothetical protein